MKPADLFTQGIADELRANGRVSLAKFGLFWVVTRPARTIQNPATKLPMELPPVVEVRFRAHKALKRLVSK